MCAPRPVTGAPLPAPQESEAQVALRQTGPLPCAPDCFGRAATAAAAGASSPHRQRTPPPPPPPVDAAACARSSPAPNDGGEVPQVDAEPVAPETPVVRALEQWTASGAVDSADGGPLEAAGSDAARQSDADASAAAENGGVAGEGTCSAEGDAVPAAAADATAAACAHLEGSVQEPLDGAEAEVCVGVGSLQHLPSWNGALAGARRAPEALIQTKQSSSDCSPRAALLGPPQQSCARPLDPCTRLVDHCARVPDRCPPPICGS